MAAQSVGLEPADEGASDLFRFVTVDKMTGTGNRNQRQLIVDPAPGLIQRAVQEGFVGETVNHERWAFDPTTYRGVFRVRWPRVIGFVVIQHALERTSTERFDIKFPRVRLSYPSRNAFRSE